ncbi:MAG: YgfZ/GcvT domain-containing protein [Gaiella sp.]
MTTASHDELATLRSAVRPRETVAVTGPDAVAHLDRMVSNDIGSLAVGETSEALLLTPKARIVAPLLVWRRGADDLLLLTEPGLGEAVRKALLRARLRAQCEVEVEPHRSLLLLGTAEGGLPCADFGVPAVEVLDGDPPADAEPIDPDELERLRILARTPRWGRELDDRVLPAEAGLERRAISFTKGCYPGQEPVARLHYRGHPNRTLRVLAIDAEQPPPYDAELVLAGKVVGRVTSVAPDPDHGLVALAYVRREVAEDAELAVAGGGRAWCLSAASG